MLCPNENVPSESAYTANLKLKVAKNWNEVPTKGDICFACYILTIKTKLCRLSARRC